MLEHEFPLFNAEDIERQEKITLENVAQQVSTSVRISVSCSCKLRCTGRCRCVKKQPEVFNINHILPEDHDYGNLLTLATRIQVALVPTIASARKRVRQD